MSKTARVYKIDMPILNRGHVSFQTLLDELEVSPATLKRDLDYLKDRLGAPIVYDRCLNGYKFGAEYRGQNHELSGLWFHERELYSLLMTHQLLSELDSDGVISRHLQPLLESIHQLRGPAASKFFELVVNALFNRRRIRMPYLTRSRAEASDRDVLPQRLGTRALQAEMDAGFGIYAGAGRHWATLSFDAHATQGISQEEWHPKQAGRWTDEQRYELKSPFVDEIEPVMDFLRPEPAPWRWVRISMKQ